jgi:AcrR family transcriptional regulator
MVERKKLDVNTRSGRRRSYDSSRRQEQARQARERIMDVALEKFLADGFASTTVAAIAEDAAVSPDTLYKAFGGKPGLVRALCERGLQGSGATPAEQRSDALLQSEQNPTQLMLALGRMACEVAPRVAPLMLLLKAAVDTDPDMEQLLTELNDTRLQRMTDNARHLIGRGIIRSDLSVEEAGEISWIYTSPELYGLLVGDRGWSPERFGAFVGHSLAAALLPPYDQAHTSSG